MANDGRRSVRLLVFGASLREGSMNDMLAALAANVAEEKGATVERGTMSEYECPAYDTDVELSTGLPAGAQALRDKLIAVDGFMIASPEYNASMPGVLKNTIDWVSRFRPQPFNGKQALLMSASPSMVGGNRGLWALRVPFEHLGTRVYPDMFSLGQAHQAWDGDAFKEAAIQERLDRTLGCFLDLVEATKHYPRIKKVWVEFLGEHPNAATDRIEESEEAA